jgi:hypothetical protein
MMPKLGYFVLGQYNMACDQCGRGFKSSDMRKRWDGAWVDAACWEPRQPQDFVRGIRDDPSVAVARIRNIIYLQNDPDVPSAYPLGGDYLGANPLGGP